MGINKRNPADESGSIVVFVIFMLAILAAVPYAYRLMGLSRHDTNKIMSKDQSRDIARGGVLDALHWFRRQTTQPVGKISDPSGILYPDAAFAPDNSNTPKGGSIEPTMGLVKEYEFSPEKNIWARHEVRRQSVDNSGNPSVTDPRAAHDISALRSPTASAGDGLAWSLVCRGIVYQRNSPLAAFDQPPNRILSETFAYSEIRKISISSNILSQRAVIVTPNANTIEPLEYTTISGEFTAPAIMTFNSTGFNPGAASISGTSNVEVVPSFPMTTLDLLGVSPSELLAMSDMVIGTQMLPYPGTPYFSSDNAAGDSSIFYINGQLYANSTPPGVNIFLNQGSGILFLDGPVNLTGQFRGLMILNQGASVTLMGLTFGGTIFSNGTITSGKDPANGNIPFLNNLTYNSTYVQEAINSNENYREVRSSFLLGADR